METYYDINSRITQILCRDGYGIQLTNIQYKYHSDGYQIDKYHYDDGKMKYKYEDSYDLSNRIITSSVFSGNDLVKFTTYSYDRQGNNLTEIHYDNNLTIFQTIIHTNYYNPLKLITNRLTFQNGILLSNYTYQYDLKGNLTGLEIRNIDQDIIHYEYIQHDDNGNIIYFETGKNDQESNQTTIMSYNSNHQLIEKKYFNHDENTNYTIQNVYENNNIRIEYYFTNLILEYYCIYQTDDNGLIQEYKRYNPVHELEFISQAEYSENGKKSSIQYSFPINNYTWTCYYDYDSTENLKSYTKYICGELKELVMYYPIHN